VKESLYYTEDNVVAQRLQRWYWAEKSGKQYYRIISSVSGILFILAILSSVFGGSIGIGGGFLVLILFLLPVLITLVDFLIIMPSWGRKIFTTEIFTTPVDLNGIVNDIREYALKLNTRNLSLLLKIGIVIGGLSVIGGPILWILITIPWFLMLAAYSLARRVIVEAGLCITVLSDKQRMSGGPFAVWALTIFLYCVLFHRPNFLYIFCCSYVIFIYWLLYLSSFRSVLHSWCGSTLPFKVHRCKTPQIKMLQRGVTFPNKKF